MKYLLFIIFTLIAFSISGQFTSSYEFSNSNTPDYQPKDNWLIPNDFYTVDKTSGEFNISLPIHMANVDNIGLDISLNYKPGIKEDDIPSEIGLQWKLNCYGTITADIIGMSDFAANYKYFNSPMDIDNDDKLFDHLGNEVPEVYYAKIHEGERDTGPDIFTFTFGSKRFTFYISSFANGVYSVETNDESYQVSIIKNTINDIEFIIKDGFGNTFICGGENYDSKIYYPLNKVWNSAGFLVYGNTEFPAKWYLKRIITAKGYEISYNYSGNIRNYLRKWREQVDILADEAWEDYFDDGLERTSKDFERRYLEAISAKNKSQDIILNIDLSYEDYVCVNNPTNHVYAGNVIVKKLQNIIVNEKGYKFPFKYSFDYITETSTKDVSKFQLSSVDQVSQLGNILKLYHFEYYAGNMVLDNNFDFWGYPNGVRNQENTENSVTNRGFLFPYSTVDGQYYDGPNRTPNALYIVGACLKSIIFRTNGIYTFTYGAHKIPITYANDIGTSHGAGLRIEEISLPGGDKIRYDYHDNISNNSILRVKPVNKFYTYGIFHCTSINCTGQFPYLVFAISIVSEKFYMPFNISPVGYKYITELRNDGQQGKIEYYSDFNSSYNGIGQTFSFEDLDRPPGSEWTREHYIGWIGTPKFIKSGQKYVKEMTDVGQLSPEEYIENPGIVTNNGIMIANFSNHNMYYGNLNGDVRLIKFYENDNGNYRIVKKIDNTVIQNLKELNTYSSIIHAKGHPMAPGLDPNYPYYLIIQILLSQSFADNYPLFLSSIVPRDIHILNNRVPTVIVETDYLYDDGAQTISKTILKNYELSTGKISTKSINVNSTPVSTTTYKYSTDLGFQNLIDANFILTPLEILTSGIETKGIRNDYDIINNSIVNTATYKYSWEEDNYYPVSTFSNFNMNGLPKTISFNRENIDYNLTYENDQFLSLIDWQGRIMSYNRGTNKQLESIVNYDLQQSNYNYNEWNELSFVGEKFNDIQNLITNYYAINGGNNRIQHNFIIDGENYNLNKDWFYDVQGRLTGHYTGNFHLISTIQHNEFGATYPKNNLGDSYTSTTVFDNSIPRKPISTKSDTWVKGHFYNYSLNGSSIYGWPTNTLYKLEHIDENNNYTWKYTDILGRTVRIVEDPDGNNEKKSDYIYDSGGNLSRIYCGNNQYIFQYDGYNRLYSKTTPGVNGASFTYYMPNIDLIDYTIDANSNILRYEYTQYNEIDKIYLNEELISDFYYGIINEENGKLKLVKHRILNSQNWITQTFNNYDIYSRPDIISLTGPYGINVDKTISYDLLDNITQENVTYSVLGINESILDEYKYDDYVRLRSFWRNDKLVYSYDYDNFDKKRIIKYGAPTIYEAILDYNSMDWLKSINNIVICQEPCKEDGGTGGGGRGGGDFNVSEDGRTRILYNTQDLLNSEPTIIYSDINRNVYSTEDTTVFNYTFDSYIYEYQGNINFTDSIIINYIGFFNSSDVINLFLNTFESQHGLLNQDYRGTVEYTLKNRYQDEIPTDNYYGDCQYDVIFAEELYYDQGNSTVNANPQYNGNISYVRWQNRDKIGLYGYNYDALDQLTNAFYTGIATECEDDIAPGDPIDVGRYDALNFGYDYIGNITSIYRKGDLANGEIGVIDNLNNFQYTNNQLNSLTESGDILTGFMNVPGGISTFTYDNNGNTTSAKNQSISNIEYNYLNLPEEIHFVDGSYIINEYDASGVKWRSYFMNNQGAMAEDVYYVEKMILRNGQLEGVYHAEGRTIKHPSTGQYYNDYNVKDHLGSTRVVITNNPFVSDNILQIQDYYPFGLPHNLPPYSNNPDDKPYRYQYNNKELVVNSKLNWNDYGSRFYNPSIGRFLSIDPLAYAAPSWSPYRYAFNNPLKYIDPDGMYEWRINSQSGDFERIGDKGGDTEQFIYWNDAKEATDILKGETIYVGAIAKDRYREGEFSYGVSTHDLWSDLPDEYQGAYDKFDLVERYTAKLNKDFKYESIKQQEAAGLSRQQMIWNRQDYGLYLDNTYGSQSGFIIAYDTGLLGMMLPGGFNQAARAGHNALRSGAGKSRGFYPQFNFSVVPQAKMSWNQFQKVTKGKFKGPNSRMNAASAYKKYKANFN